MSIVRNSRPKDQYTVLSNEVLRDSRLSYRARGILVCILSRPDNWRTTSADLAQEGKEGRDAIRAALNELEGAGYLVRQKWQNDQGQWVSQSVVYDRPEAWKPDAGLPGVGEPGPLRSNEKKEREEEEPSAPPAGGTQIVTLPADLGADEKPAHAPRITRKGRRGVLPDEGGKPPSVRVSDLFDMFTLEWGRVANERPELAMVPLYTTQQACYAWLRNKFLAPAHGSPWKPEDVYRLIQEFIREVRYGSVTPKPGMTAWQSFQFHHAKLIYRVLGYSPSAGPEDGTNYVIPDDVAAMYSEMGLTK